MQVGVIQKIAFLKEDEIDLTFLLKTPYGSREAYGGHRKVPQNGTGFLRILF